MKIFVPVAIVAVLVVAGVAISLNVGGGDGSDAERSTAFVDPAVWEALEEQADVEVYIALRELDVPLAEQDAEMRKAHAASVQASVYSALSSDDFDTTYQFRDTAALTGRITKSGVALAAALPDVLGIIIPGQGKGGVEPVTPETGVASGTLTGTISLLVEQVVVDGVIVEEILAPVTSGRVSIPELGVAQELALDGSYNFTDLSLPRYPMLVSVEVRADGYRPTTWASYIVLHPDSGPIFTPRIESGDAPMLIDPCPDLVAYSRGSGRKSAAQELRAELCRELGYR